LWFGDASSDGDMLVEAIGIASGTGVISAAANWFG